MTPERLPLGGELQREIEGALSAIRHELDAVSRCSGDTIDVREGHLVGALGHDQLWSFECDAETQPPAETPGVLTAAGQEPVPVDVVAAGDLTIVLSVHGELDGPLDHAVLSLDAGFILRRLADRLDDLVLSGDADEELADALLFGDPDDVIAPGEGESPAGANPEDEQDLAARAAVEPGLRLTWGPPGTGKTRVLGRAVAEAVRRGDTVVVLAHANAAVDVAAARLAVELEGEDLLDEGRVLRVGASPFAEAPEHARLVPERVALRAQPDLDRERDALAAERRRLSDGLRHAANPTERRERVAALGRVRSESAQIERLLRDAVDDLIADAQVVLTTLSRFVLDGRLWSKSAEVMVIDEASMAPLPFVLALALRGATTLSCFGDFRQLPPIAVSEADVAQQWFGRDVFELSGARELVEHGLADRRLVTLRTQYRMGEQISGAVSELAYGGMLMTHRDARHRAIRIAEHQPIPDAEIVLVDTSSLGSRCSIDPDPESWSRFDPLVAMLAVSIAELMVDDGIGTVGLLSPYRSQVLLHAKAVADRPSLEAATIHRFQGSECDGIVVDLVDGPDLDRPSRLTGTDRDLARRLINVAASRARGKLVILANRDFVGRHHPLDSPARRFLELCDEHHAESIDALDVVSELASAMDRVPTWCRTSADARTRLVEDWSGAAHVDANLPDVAFGDAWPAALAASRRDATLRLRAPVSIARPLESSDVELDLRVAGPLPWVIVDDSTLWIGSRDPDGPWARRNGRAVVTAFRRLVTPYG